MRCSLRDLSKIDHQHRTALLRLAEWALRHAPAKVGGIHANNTFPADFVYDNLMMQANVIQARLP